MKLPYRICLVSQTRVDDPERIHGKPVSEGMKLASYFDFVAFICFSETGKFLKKKLCNNMVLYTVPIGWSYSLSSTIRNLVTNLCMMWIYVFNIVKEYRIDFIRAENLVLGGIPTFFVSKLTSTPYAIWLAGSEETVINIRYGKSLISRIIIYTIHILKRLIFRDAQFVISVSADLFKETKSNLGKQPFITPNFVDLEKFHPSTNSSQKNPEYLKFIYLGRFETEKGVLELLNAIKMIQQNQHCKFYFAGYGTLLRDIQISSAKDSRISYLGALGHEEVAEILRTMDVLIQPSLTEGMPAAIMEALATGVPVIASSVGRIPEIIEDGIDGYLVPPGNPIMLKAAISKMIDSKNQLEHMKIAARKKAEQISGRYIPFHLRLYSKYLKLLSEN